MLIHAIGIFAAISVVGRPDETASSDSREHATQHECVYIEGGQFLMGSPVTKRSSARFRSIEKPQHEVSVESFLIGRYLVTAEQYCEFLNQAAKPDELLLRGTGVYDYSTIHRVGTKYRPKKYAERCPAYPVTWTGASRFCEWLSTKTGVTYRLPTESEWEFSARGTTLRKWPWGDDEPESEYRKGRKPKDIPFYDLRGYRWMHVPWDGRKPWIKASVGSFPSGATPEGVYDMLGYYSGEWCSDVFRSYSDHKTKESETQEEKAGLQRVLRGMTKVKVDYATYEPILAIPRSVVGGDGGKPIYTPGMSWSREGENPTTHGAMFRVAADRPGKSDKKASSD